MNRNLKTVSLGLAVGWALVFQASAAGKFWNEKPSSAWSEKEIQRCSQGRPRQRGQCPNEFSGWRTGGCALRLELSKVTMQDLADTLDPFLDKPVIDTTALKGTYTGTLDLPMEVMLTMMQNTTRANGLPGPGQGGFGRRPGGGGLGGRGPGDAGPGGGGRGGLQGCDPRGNLREWGRGHIQRSDLSSRAEAWLKARSAQGAFRHDYHRPPRENGH